MDRVDNLIYAPDGVMVSILDAVWWPMTTDEWNVYVLDYEHIK